jgi:hypothetical protein
VGGHIFGTQLCKQLHSQGQKIPFFMSSIKFFNFISKTRLTISGQSDGVSPRGRAGKISGQATFEVNVINRSGQPIFLQIPMQSWYFWYK